MHTIGQHRYEPRCSSLSMSDRSRPTMCYFFLGGVTRTVVYREWVLKWNLSQVVKGRGFVYSGQCGSLLIPSYVYRGPCQFPISKSLGRIKKQGINLATCAWIGLMPGWRRANSLPVCQSTCACIRCAQKSQLQPNVRAPKTIPTILKLQD